MEHLPEHPHALIDTNGNVKQILVFSSHDSNLLLSICQQSDLLYGEKLDIICCCDNGIAGIGWQWNGSSFIEPPNKNVLQ